MNILRLSTLSLTLAIAFVTLGYVDSASADPKDCGGEHCVDHGGDGGGNDATYSLEFLDPITGDNGVDPWTENATNKIGFQVLDNSSTTNVDLSFFANMSDGEECFNGGLGHLSDHTFRVTAMQAFKGRGGRPEVWLWIRAETRNVDEAAFYLLITFGDRGTIPDDWPPSTESTPATLVLTNYEMKLENGQPDLISVACESEGPFDDDSPWDVDVCLNHLTACPT